jgi:deazaflavin-dependent oxidoreductase (nitroreductase family)
MTIPTNQVQQLRASFRGLNRFMLLMWRLGLGRFLAGPRVGYVMVLATTGRKSGLRRLAPLNFDEDPAAVYCLAGFGRKTHWLRNLESDPSCEVWLPDGRRVAGSGVRVLDEGERVALVRRLLVRAGFATKIAEPGLDPMGASDEQIAALGERYGVRYEAVRIELGAPVSGPGGPDDLIWVWPAAGAALLALLIVRRRR